MIRVSEVGRKGMLRKHVIMVLLIIPIFLLGVWFGTATAGSKYTKQLEEKDAIIDNIIDENTGLLKSIETSQEEIEKNRAIMIQYEEQIEKLSVSLEYLQNRIGKQDGDSSFSADEMAVRTNDILYKLFYGEWEIVSVIEGRNFDQLQTDNYIGKIVKYANDSIIVDGEVVLAAPAYAYGIIPMDYYAEFSQGYGPNEPIFDLDNEYFVYVWVETWVRGDYSEEERSFKQFYVVDDNTLVLDAIDGYYIMKRLAYMENHDTLATYQDYWW